MEKALRRLNRRPDMVYNIGLVYYVWYYRLEYYDKI